MKFKLFLLLIFITFVACQREAEEVRVTYQVSEGYSPVHISYRDPGGTLVADTAFLESVADVWQKDFLFVRGDIVYISAIYADSSSSVKIRIITGGKVYKEAFSLYEPDKYLIVSGVIPY